MFYLLSGFIQTVNDVAAIALILLKKKAVWAAAIGLVLIILHLVFEKWRWQMVPA